MIESAVTGILSDFSLLIVCIMAHGYQGTLSGSGSSELPINNILHQLTALLPPHIPLVSTFILYPLAIKEKLYFLLSNQAFKAASFGRMAMLKNNRWCRLI